MGALLLAPLLIVPDLSAAHAETRTLKLYNTHTKERVEITFKKNGRYVPSGLRDINRFLRDWRRNEMTTIDPQLLDLVWEVYQEVGGRDYIHVVSSYRSPATNNMLRQRSRGVAQNSQHTRGKAMDFFIPGVDLTTLRATGLRKQVGGVGFYPTSGSPFVHLDTGSVRHWPKMSRAQLAKVFPDGRTVHIPSDGKPMAGYQQALADLKSGRRSSPTVVAAAAPSGTGPRTTGQNLTAGQDGDLVRPAPGRSRNFLAALFSDEEEDNEEAVASARVAAVRPGAPVPPGAVPGNAPGVGQTANASTAGANAPVTVAPPVPVLKAEAAPQPTEDPAPAVSVPALVATALPRTKPQPAAGTLTLASAATAAPNTLDSQRLALESGAAPAAASTPIIASTATVAPADAGRFALPPIKPAALVASTATDPVAAIVAATGGDPDAARKPQIGTSTLAYASATGTPAQPTAQSLLQEKVAAAAARAAEARNKPARPTSVSGQVPPAVIHDPLAGFASLPDKSAPQLISGTATTRNGTFSMLSHPNQRALNTFLAPGNRFLSKGFDRLPYDDLRTDRFAGAAVVVLPVMFTR
ncbi:DUF882 domain-containing protein [Polymorphum gilvum]|uniref:Murein endopeptidase K n=1 Tax=Polymorphum gilvum (strain LMG 25793 / CGMCC 1.9160 / SL003B-26A1) TaxID=991905 RepID=F2IWK0_POLGS|nr:DUF882 domain-containing protein [Polymorphum gilvum]ADZ69299.1 ATP/GTP-binding site-containing protein A [Polymorphum gilvum SL003B-26A1]